MRRKDPVPKAPRHLRQATRQWFEQVMQDFVLEPHHVRLLTLACEAWDRCQQAREALHRHGLTFVDFHGSPKPRPEVAIERDSRLAYARLLRELQLDIAAPDEPPRAPALGRAGRAQR